MVDNGDVQAEAADQLQRAQAGHILVASQAALEKLLVGEQEDGPVPTWYINCNPEHLHLGFRTGEEETVGQTGHFTMSTV